MKNLLRFLIGISSLIAFCSAVSVSAADYVDIDNTEKYKSGDEAPFYENLAKVTKQNALDYIREHPGSTPNQTFLDGLRAIISKTIVDNGGWFGNEVKLGDQLWTRIVRFEDGKLIIGCGNLDLGYITWGSAPGCGTLAANQSCSGPTQPNQYVSSWTNHYSQCNVIGSWVYNPTTNKANINCVQTNSPTPNYTRCGALYNIHTTRECLEDVCFWVGDEKKCDTRKFDCSYNTTTGDASYGCQSDRYPSDTTNPSYITTPITMDLSNAEEHITDLVANNTDTGYVKIPVSGTPTEGKDIIWPDNSFTFTNFRDISNDLDTNDLYGTGFSSDRVNHSDVGKALNLNNITTTITGDTKKGNFTLTINNIKSRAPINTISGAIAFNHNTNEIKLNNLTMNFSKPFTGILQSYNATTKTWGDKGVTLGTSILYQIIPLFANGVTDLNIDDAKISGYVEPTLGVRVTDEKKSTTTLQYAKIITEKVLKNQLGATFEARINSLPGATTLEQDPQIEVSRPIISYQFNNDGNNPVSYFLSKYSAAKDETPIGTDGSEFLNIKILGQLQANGWSEFSGQEANITNTYTPGLRSKIIGKSYELTRNMQSNSSSNNVYYVEGDVTIENGTISGTSEGDNILINTSDRPHTLIVKNGNVTIKSDITSTQTFNTLGIIVLNDTYNVRLGADQKGNIFITPNVHQIRAIIYADGAIMSVDADDKPFETDTATRTNELSDQLWIKGSIFTRNTIGGALLKTENNLYSLPGNIETSDFGLAMSYDLNYLRRGYNDCQKNSTNTCIYANPVIIEHDQSELLDPPPGFY